MTNTNATPALEYCLALAPRSDRWEAEADLRALMAERDRLRAALVMAADTLDEAAKSFALNNPRAARPNLFHLNADACRAALANREGVKP